MSYVMLAQRMTKKEVILFQMQKQGEEAIRRALEDAMQWSREIYGASAEPMTDR